MPYERSKKVRPCLPGISQFPSLESKRNLVEKNNESCSYAAFARCWHPAGTCNGTELASHRTSNPLSNGLLILCIGEYTLARDKLFYYRAFTFSHAKTNASGRAPVQVISALAPWERSVISSQEHVIREHDLHLFDPYSYTGPIFEAEHFICAFALDRKFVQITAVMHRCVVTAKNMALTETHSFRFSWFMNESAFL